MRDIDEMDILTYFRILGREIALAEEHAEEAAPRASGGEVVELRRGTIDALFG